MRIGSLIPNMILATSCEYSFEFRLRNKQIYKLSQKRGFNRYI